MPIQHQQFHGRGHNKGACKYYISALGVGGGSEGNAYFAYVVRGVGVQRQNAYIDYVRDQNSYEISFETERHRPAPPAFFAKKLN